MMKKEYESPLLEFIIVKEEDIITASLPGTDEIGPGDYENGGDWFD